MDKRVLLEIGDYFPTKPMTDEQREQYEAQIAREEKERAILETKNKSNY